MEASRLSQFNARIATATSAPGVARRLRQQRERLLNSHFALYLEIVERRRLRRA